MYVESFEKLSGNDRFEGFAIDLATELSAVLGFNFTIKLVDDGKVTTKYFVIYYLLQNMCTMHNIFIKDSVLKNCTLLDES